MLPLFRVEVCLQTINMLLRNFCILHCFKKHFSCGRAALAIFPPDQPCLHCSLLIQRIALETCFYCVWVKSDSFKNGPPLACSFSADICSKEHLVVWMIYRDSKTLQPSPQFLAGHATNHTYHSLSVTVCHPSHYHQSQPHWVVILLVNKGKMYMLYTTTEWYLSAAVGTYKCDNCQ